VPRVKLLLAFHRAELLALSGLSGSLSGFFCLKLGQRNEAQPFGLIVIFFFFWCLLLCVFAFVAVVVLLTLAANAAQSRHLSAGITVSFPWGDEKGEGVRV
jgi:hypothetical protein